MARSLRLPIGLCAVALKWFLCAPAEEGAWRLRDGDVLTLLTTCSPHALAVVGVCSCSPHAHAPPSNGGARIKRHDRLWSTSQAQFEKLMGVKKEVTVHIFDAPCGMNGLFDVADGPLYNNMKKARHNRPLKCVITSLACDHSLVIPSFRSS